MLAKQQSKTGGNVRVTFVLPADTQADRIHVVGDFNDWRATTPMRRQRNRSWKAAVNLEPEREFQFRYCLDGERWINDPEADAYVPNPFGTANSVVRTGPASGSKRATKRATKRRGSAS